MLVRKSWRHQFSVSGAIRIVVSPHPRSEMETSVAAVGERSPTRATAPRVPPTTQLLLRSARTICSRSACSSALPSLAALRPKSCPAFQSEQSWVSSRMSSPATEARASRRDLFFHYRRQIVGIVSAVDYVFSLPAMSAPRSDVQVLLPSVRCSVFDQRCNLLRSGDVDRMAGA
jgi:hypothetical protein